ncbi:DUF2589 domain-containing protein [Streptomyces sp. NPDC018019]|uniref:DUF2589 domain-containing protein n=1 Tax=Streptomyces sp. NPDC018019 TaxID=3365030 RepID=UPI0037B7F4E9
MTQPPAPRPDTEAVSEATLTPLQIAQLLGGAYQSVIEAQALATRKTIEVFTEVGFHQHGNHFLARTMQFDVRRQELDENLSLAERNVRVSVPLLSMVNLPTLGIDQAEIEMGLQVTTHQEEKHSDSKEEQNKKPAKPGTITARVASSTTTATLKVKSVLKQSPIPGTHRLEQILDSAIVDMQQAITDPSPTPDPETLDIQAGAVKTTRRALEDKLKELKGGLEKHIRVVNFLVDRIFEARRMVELRFARSAVKEVCVTPWNQTAPHLEGELKSTDAAEALSAFLDTTRELWRTLGQGDDITSLPHSTAAE